MRVCIAYESKYGNGKKCMEYLQNVISKKGHKVKMFSVHEKEPTLVPSADLYVFSSPTHMGDPAGKMVKFLKKMQISNDGANYSLVTTCMKPPKTKCLKKMEKILTKRGLSKVSDGVMIKVTGMKGPLESGFERMLDEFADNILK